MVSFLNVFIAHFEKQYGNINFLIDLFIKKFPSCYLDWDSKDIPLTKIIEIGLFFSTNDQQIFFNFVQAAKQVDYFEMVKVLFNDLMNTKDHFLATLNPSYLIPQQTAPLPLQKKNLDNDLKNVTVKTISKKKSFLPKKKVLEELVKDLQDCVKNEQSVQPLIPEFFLQETNQPSTSKSCQQNNSLDSNIIPANTDLQTALAFDNLDPKEFEENIEEILSFLN